MEIERETKAQVKIAGVSPQNIRETLEPGVVDAVRGVDGVFLVDKHGKVWWRRQSTDIWKVVQ